MKKHSIRWIWICCCIFLCSQEIAAQHQKLNTSIMKETVSTSGIVPQSAHRIWDKLSEFGGTEKFVPELISHVTVKGKGVGAIRTIHLHGGAHIIEELTDIQPHKKQLQFSILSTPMPVQQYIGTMTVTATDTEQCTVLFESNYTVEKTQQEEMRTVIKGFQETFISNLHL